ncbi:MAG: hypothetical protein ACHQUC_10855 [Chlamydiales bacterium]
MKKALIAYLLFPFLAFAQPTEHPFDYDLHLFSLAGDSQRTLICFHGYGDNYQIAQSLKDLYPIKSTLVSFNFPEHDIKQGREYDPKIASFGTIHEILPALYVMKKIVLDNALNSIDLYGFSAGGGALINLIAVLNTTTYDAELQKIGISAAEKKSLLSAIEKGVIILDTPLKSIEEIIDFRGSTEEFEILAKHYKDNGLRPIDSLQWLKGLSLTILLHFQKHDEILSNRDDQLYIERLQATQRKEKITLILTDEGGHMTPHRLLWTVSPY